MHLRASSLRPLLPRRRSPRREPRLRKPQSPKKLPPRRVKLLPPLRTSLPRSPSVALQAASALPSSDSGRRNLQRRRRKSQRLKRSLPLRPLRPPLRPMLPRQRKPQLLRERPPLLQKKSQLFLNATASLATSSERKKRRSPISLLRVLFNRTASLPLIQPLQ